MTQETATADQDVFWDTSENVKQEKKKKPSRKSEGKTAKEKKNEEKPEHENRKEKAKKGDNEKKEKTDNKEEPKKRKEKKSKVNGFVLERLLQKFPLWGPDLCRCFVFQKALKL